MVMGDMFPSRADVEDFLYHEAGLLDEWQLDEWFSLFADGATYEIPSADSTEDAKSDTTLFYIADDYVRLYHRIERLKNKEAHSEYPRSRGFRMVSNVRLHPPSSEHLMITSQFITMRSRDDMTDMYFGRHRYQLKINENTLKIFSKRTILASSSLRPQGRISIIL